jgi:hypothetical protein
VSTTSTTLKWTASDVDNDDLTYTVYFGTENPLTIIISTDQTENTLEVNLNASTNYYWKVVVKDGNGGITKGQLWSFKTD